MKFSYTTTITVEMEVIGEESPAVLGGDPDRAAPAEYEDERTIEEVYLDGVRVPGGALRDLMPMLQEIVNRAELSP